MPSKGLEPARWRKGVLEVMDQTQLPVKLTYLSLSTVEQVCVAIKTMKVRGAPLIGVVGAFGLVLALKKIRTRDIDEFRNQLREYADRIIQTRPTGVNLRWAVERVFESSIQAQTVTSI